MSDEIRYMARVFIEIYEGDSYLNLACKSSCDEKWDSAFEDYIYPGNYIHFQDNVVFKVDKKQGRWTFDSVGNSALGHTIDKTTGKSDTLYVTHGVPLIPYHIWNDVYPSDRELEYFFNDFDWTDFDIKARRKAAAALKGLI